MTSPIHLQTQTAAAGTQSTTRPRAPYDSPAAMSQSQEIQCCRCQKSLSVVGSSVPTKGAVQFGLNSYYCSRCASMVGFNNR